MNYGYEITKDQGIAVFDKRTGERIAWNFTSTDEAEDFCLICEAWDEVNG